MKCAKWFKSVMVLFSAVFLLVPSLIAPAILIPMTAVAQTQPVDNVNLNDSAFKIVVCDGPQLPSTMTTPSGYIPCNFNYAIFQIQHLINIAIVVGVFAAIVLFSYAGYIYISGGMRGDANAHSTAIDIFRKVGIGFIIMLSAWFIVYQIMAWLTGSSGFAVLLGKPS